MYYYYLSVDSEVPLLGPTRKKRRLRRLQVYQHQGVSLVSCWGGSPSNPLVAEEILLHFLLQQREVKHI